VDVCSGQLDTPLHTATLLSMLKMAQQLAEAEAQLQEQQEQLQSVRHQLKAGAARDQLQKPARVQELRQDEQQCLKAAYSSAAVLASPAVALLRRCRQQAEKLSSSSAPGGPGALDQVLFVHLSALLIAALQQRHAVAQMVGPSHAKVGKHFSAHILYYHSILLVVSPAQMICPWTRTAYLLLASAPGGVLHIFYLYHKVPWASDCLMCWRGSAAGS